MRKIKARYLAVPLFVVVVAAAFQNCDGGFHYDPASGSLSSSGTGNMTGAFGVKAYQAGATTPMADTLSFDTGFDYELRVSGTNISTAILTWSLAPTSSASCALTSVGNVTARSLRCASQGVVVVNVQALWPDTTISVATLSHQVGSAPTPTPLPNDPNTVSFHIVAGTAGAPWNTSATAVLAFVGQTLRVYNDDNQAHEIHTGGSPFPHATAAIQPNTSATYTIQNAHSRTATDVYDHLSSTTAVFYIEAINGAAQYTRTFSVGGSLQSCASCHGALAMSQKRGASFTTIKNAITGNKGGMAAITLTDNEIRAIVYELNK